MRSLESLVKNLRSQLQQLRAETRDRVSRDELVRRRANPDHIRGQDRAIPDQDEESIRDRFGRLVVHSDIGRRYVSSGFWTEVND